MFSQSNLFVFTVGYYVPVNSRLTRNQACAVPKYLAAHPFLKICAQLLQFYLFIFLLFFFFCYYLNFCECEIAELSFIIKVVRFTIKCDYVIVANYFAFLWTLYILAYHPTSITITEKIIQNYHMTSLLFGGQCHDIKLI